MVHELTQRAARIAAPLRALEVSGEERHAVGEGEAVAYQLGRQRIALLVEADAAHRSVRPRAEVRKLADQVQVGE
jgi:hypothetical protein